MVLEMERRHQLILLIVAALILFGAGYKYAQVRSGGPVGEQALVTGAGDGSGKVDGLGAGTVNSGEERPIVVHVAGEVQRPGVYHLADGARVVDAVNMAGPTDNSALDYLNLAAPLKDGSQIMVYARTELAAPPGGTAASLMAAPPAVPGSAVRGLININTASRAELEELPGIGPSLAGRIVDHRTKNGPFLSVEDLMSVSGIGEKRFEQIRDLVTVH